jgi:single-strand DNA-binding protein
MSEMKLTITGNVVKDVDLRFTKSGDPVASFRVAMSTRRFDRARDSWVDSDTHFFSVTCWRNLALNVMQSVKKGMPVIVQGRLRSREVERPCGDTFHIVRYQDIEADAVGPDLARGIATFTKVKREGVVESEARGLADEISGAGELGDDAPGEEYEEVDLETGEITPTVAA